MFFVQKIFSHPFCWEKCFSLMKNRKVIQKIPKPPYSILADRSYILHPQLSMAAAPFFLSQWNRQTDKQTDRQIFFLIIVCVWLGILSFTPKSQTLSKLFKIKFWHRHFPKFGNIFLLKIVNILAMVWNVCFTNVLLALDTKSSFLYHRLLSFWPPSS